jgi:hypothetical protein
VLPQSGYSTAVILFRFVKSLTLLGSLLSWWNFPSYPGLSYNDEVDTAAIAPFVKVWFKLPCSLSSRINLSCSLSMHITMVHHNMNAALLFHILLSRMHLSGYQKPLCVDPNETTT